MVHIPSISPDGKRIVFESHGEGEELSEVSLWVREMDSESARRLDGTDGHRSHFWSPDSRFIGFFAQGKLKKMGLSGGPTVTLADAPRGRGGTWNRRGLSSLHLVMPDHSIVYPQQVVNRRLSPPSTNHVSKRHIDGPISYRMATTFCIWLCPSCRKKQRSTLGL